MWFIIAPFGLNKLVICSIVPSLRDRLMVGLQILDLRILVRIQVPQLP